VPKLRCTQPDFTTNKTVAEVHTNAGAIVTIHMTTSLKPTWFLVMKTVIFKAISLQTIELRQSCSRFSVPVDATNTYVDFRVEIVYVKLKPVH
jgi:hypothetical protein